MVKCLSFFPLKCPIELHPSKGQPLSSGSDSFDKFRLCLSSIFLCFDLPFVGISDGTFFTGLFVVERFTEVLSSVSVSDLIEALPRCFDFLVLFIRADFLLGLASAALSESESEFEPAEDESVEVDVADETSFLGSGLGFSGVTLGGGLGGAVPMGYFLGRPRPRPEVELPDCRRSSLTGAAGGGFSSSDSEEFEKILFSTFLDFAVAAADFLGTGRFLAALLIDAAEAALGAAGAFPCSCKAWCCLITEGGTLPPVGAEGALALLEGVLTG